MKLLRSLRGAKALSIAKSLRRSKLKYKQEIASPLARNDTSDRRRGG